MSSFPPIGPDTPVAPPLPGYVTNFNDPQDSQRYVQLVVILAIFVPLSTICVLLRLWTRIFIVRQFGWDDVCVVIALGLNAGFTAATVGELQTGLADYDWNVRMIDFIASDHLAKYNYYNVVVAITFWIMYAFAKTSILMLYLRVIGQTSPKIRIGIYVLIFAIFVSTIACLADLLTFCTPVQKLFDLNLPGSCPKFDTHLFIAQASLSAVFDWLILIPPIPIVWRLASTIRRKIGLILMLCIGVLVSGIALARAVLWSPRYTLPGYQMYGEFNNTYLSALEINLAITVICFPALSQFYIWMRSASKQHSGAPPLAGDAGSPQDRSPDESSGSNKSPAKSPGKPKKPSSVTRIIGGIYSQFGRSQFEAEKEPVQVTTVEEKESMGTIGETSSQEGKNTESDRMSQDAAHIV